MSKAFEGVLRTSAAWLVAMSMRLEHGKSEDPQPWDPWDPRATQRTWIRHACHLIIIPFFIAGCRILSLHIGLFTSFLAEVYWLTLAAIWVTRRFIRTRQLGHSEDNDWTFGQTLSLILVVAPLAAFLEHLLSNPQYPRRGQSQTATAVIDQLEVAEAQENVQVDIDLEHVRSTSHRGALFLAAVSYIQVGVFFSADATPGILQPLRRLAISTFVLNPMLQIVWIHYALWIPHMNWSRPLKMTVYYIALVTLVGTSVAEYVEAPTDGGINEVDTVYLGGITLAPLFFGYAFPILIFHLYYYFRNSTVRFIPALLCLLAPTALLFKLYLINWLLATIAASLFMEVLWYLVEVQMEKMGVAAVTCFIGRCVLGSIILALQMVFGYTIRRTPDSVTLCSRAVVSGCVLASFGILASLTGWGEMTVLRIYLDEGSFEETMRHLREQITTRNRTLLMYSLR